jgi:hypothetical protein
MLNSSLDLEPERLTFHALKVLEAYDACRPRRVRLSYDERVGILAIVGGAALVLLSAFVS